MVCNLKAIGTCEKFIAQVQDAIVIAEKYLADQHFSMTQSEDHTAYNIDALVVKCTNVHPGGGQPVMRCSEYNGGQSMILENRLLKGHEAGA